MSTYFGDVFKTIFNTGYTLLSCFRYPGTNITPFNILIGTAVIIFSIKMIKHIGGLQNDI